MLQRVHFEKPPNIYYPYNLANLHFPWFPNYNTTHPLAQTSDYQRKNTLLLPRINYSTGKSLLRYLHIYG